jgi:hypothetical protein
LYNCRLFIFKLLINYFFSIEGDDKEDTNFLYSAVAQFDISGFVLPVVGVLFKILLVAGLLHKGCARVSTEFAAKAVLLVVGAHGYGEGYGLFALIEFSHFSQYVL